MKNKLFSGMLLVVFLLAGGNTLAQVDDRNELLSSAIDQEDPRKIIDAFLEKCYENVDVNNAQALGYANQAYQHALAAGDSDLIVVAGRVKGQLLIRCNKINESISLLRYLMQVAQRRQGSEEFRKILNSIAVSYTFNADYEQALKFNFKLLMMERADNNGQAVSMSLSNIGLVYYKMGDFREALAFYEKALGLKNSLGDSVDLSALLINIGLCYDNLKDCDKGLQYIAKAIQSCSPRCGKSLIVAEQHALGVTYSLLGRVGEAEKYFRRSYELANEFGDVRYRLENLRSLVPILIGLGRFNTAANYLQEAESLAFNHEYLDILVVVYREWSDLYTKTQNFELAARYQKKFIELNERILTGKINEITKIQSEFNEYENRAIIRSQAEILSLRNEIINNHKLLIFLLSFLGVIFLLMIVVLFKRYREKARDNYVLDKKVRERTESLDQSISKMSKNFEEQSNSVNKMLGNIRPHLKSITGLTNLILLENIDDKTLQESIILVSQTVKKLSDIVDPTIKDHD